MMTTMTAYNNDNEVKHLEKNGIEAADLTDSNIGGDSPTVNNDVEGGSGPDDLSESGASASGNRYHSQDASSHGRNGWMTIVLILGLGSLAVAVATTRGFELFNKSNPLSSNGAIVTSLQVDGTDKSSNKKSKQLKESSRSLKKKKVLKCGDVVVNRKASLKEDLTCRASDAGVINGVPNAALTLDGPDAVLKCKGKSNKVKIVQIGGDASTCKALDGYDGNLETDSSKVEVIKGNDDDGCGLPFLYGVKLLNGAKAVGCDIGNFLVGAYVGQGAKELSDVTVSNNRYGVVVETNTTVKITDITAKDNGKLGILASNGGTSIFVKDYTPGGSIELQEITASGNGGKGVDFYGSPAAGISIENANKIDVKNVNAEGNVNGIAIFKSEEIDLEEIVANDNGIGILIDISEEIDLKEVVANGNSEEGIAITTSGVSLIDNVQATGNFGTGIHIRDCTPGSDTNFENVEANNNVGSGIIIADCKGLDMTMTWTRSLSLDGNTYGLYLFRTSKVAITISGSGELTVDNNENDGIFLLRSGVDISIGEDASFSACGNGNGNPRYDLYVDRSSFTVTMAMEGDGTCVVGSTENFRSQGTITLPPEPECGRTCPDLDRFF